MKIKVLINNISSVAKLYFVINIIYNSDKKDVVIIILLLVKIFMNITFVLSFLVLNNIICDLITHLHGKF